MLFFTFLCSVFPRYGAKNVTLSKLVPILCKMLDDPSIPVSRAICYTLLSAFCGIVLNHYNNYYLKIVVMNV